MKTAMELEMDNKMRLSLMERVAKDFVSHEMNEEQQARAESLRQDFAYLAQEVVHKLDLGREQSIALTYIEAAKFFAMAAIAREEP